MTAPASGALAESITRPDHGRPLAGVGNSAPLAGVGNSGRDRRILVDVLVLVLVGLTAVALLFAPWPGIKAALLFASAAVVPGTAALRKVRFASSLEAVAVTAGVSLTLSALGTLALIWLGWFHPIWVAVGVGSISTVLIAADLRQRTAGRAEGLRIAPSRRLAFGRDAVKPLLRWTRRWGPWLIPLLAAELLWVLSLSHISLAHLGASGLLGTVPLTWYVALAILLGGAVASLTFGKPRLWLALAYLTALVFVMTGTIAALTSVPQYGWTYKHIGVIHLFLASGHTSPSVDIYNRWPGMFAFAAGLTKLTGLDPITYANWVEPIFTVLNAVAVAALAKVLSRDDRAAGLAALVFVCSSWVGQTYLSPQTFAFVLQLTAMLLIIGQFGSRAPSPAISSVVRRIGFLRRRDAAERFAPAPTIDALTATILVVLIDYLIIATHQLTPYMLLIQFAVLLALRVVKGRLLWIGMVVVTIGYLVPNLSFIQKHYGLSTGFNFSSNATVTTFGPTIHRAVLYANAGELLTAALVLSALVAAGVLISRALIERAAPLVALTLCPAVILFAQSYGGEAPLRVALFAAPWAAVLVGCGLARLRVRSRTPIAALLVTAFTGLCLVATVANAASSVYPRNELKAAEYINDHGPRNAVFELVGANFPMKVGANYPYLAGASGDSGPDLFDHLPWLATRSQSPVDLSPIIADMLSYSKTGFLVFSTSQYQYARIFHTVPVQTIRAIETAVQNSPRFRLWYQNPDTQIYRLVSPATPATATAAQNGSRLVSPAIPPTATAAQNASRLVSPATPPTATAVRSGPQAP